MPLIHIVSMQSTQFLHSMNSFDPSISLNTETISFNTIDSFYYRFCPFSFRRKTGNSETPNGMCQNNNFKNVCRRNRFSNLYICTCAAVLFVSLFSRFASACWETLHWTPPFVTSFLSSVMCVCVCFFSPLFRLANYIISCLLLSCFHFIEKRYYWFVNSMYIIMERRKWTIAVWSFPSSPPSSSSSSCLFYYSVIFCSLRWQTTKANAIMLRCQGWL